MLIRDLDRGGRVGCWRVVVERDVGRRVVGKVGCWMVGVGREAGRSVVMGVRGIDGRRGIVGREWWWRLISWRKVVSCG